MGKKGKKQFKSGNLIRINPKPKRKHKQGGKKRTRDLSAIDSELENKQSECSTRAREKAGVDSSNDEENTRLLGEKAGIDFSHGVENKRPLGFDCSDCLDFQLYLAESALEYYQHRLKDPEVFEDVKVLAACFLNSWPRFPSWRFNSTDKCHISFSAKPKNNGCDGVSPTWFFAELVEVDGGFRPILCEVLSPSAATPYHHGIVYGCGFCPKGRKFPHPPPREGSKSFEKHPDRVD